MDFIWQYWLETVFGLVTIGLGAGYKRLNNRIKESSRKQEATNGGVQALLRDRIRYTTITMLKAFAPSTLWKMWRRCISNIGLWAAMVRLQSWLRN